MSRRSIPMLLALLAACGTKHAPTDAPPAVAVVVAPPSAPAAEGTLEARLARLERTVAKLTAALDKQLGPVQPDATTVYAVPIDPRDPIEGPATAKVTIVVAFELMDPYSAQLAQTLAQVRQQHATDVRVAWKYVVVHGAPAIGAGLVACSAGKHGVWPAVRTALIAQLFAPGKSGTFEPHPERASLDQLRPAAVAAGLEGAAIDADRAACQAWLDETPPQLARFGVHTTPALFVNGRYLGGARDLAAIEAAIAFADAAARKAIADGVPAADYYASEIVGKGAKNVVGRFDD